MTFCASLFSALNGIQHQAQTVFVHNSVPRVPNSCASLDPRLQGACLALTAQSQ